MENNIVIIGYSGHAFVAIDILKATRATIIGYCDISSKDTNPYCLKFLGSESSTESINLIRGNAYFVGIGDNSLRMKVTNRLTEILDYEPINAIHPNSDISEMCKLESGIMIAPKVVINSCARIGRGVICNTASVIEHECIIGEYSHIAPNATLAGNVTVGHNTFIGAGAVVKQGVNIGNNVIVGAGTVVIRDVEDNSKIVGNPQKSI